MISFRRLLNSKYLLACLATCCFSTNLTAQQDKIKNIETALNNAETSADAMQEIMDRDSIPGLQLCFFKAGKLQLMNAGWKNNETKGYINERTAFQAASLTKVVAAYVFFRLYDKGLITLDKPLWNYYQYDRIAQNTNAKKITARMVLTHHTGLLNWEGDVPTEQWRKTPLTLQFNPGTDYLYSGEGFYFLQETMEHLTGKSFQKLVEEEVLHPFQMNDSEILWKDRLEENAAYGHYHNKKPRKLGMYRKSNAAYTLYTTATDYTAFLDNVILKGRGLKKETHRLMLSKAADAKKGKQASPDDKHVPCALGLRMQINKKEIAFWHTGSNPGFRCYFMVYPKTKEILTVFTNSDNGFKTMPDILALFLNNKQTFWAYHWRHGELD